MKTKVQINGVSIRDDDSGDRSYLLNYEYEEVYQEAISQVEMTIVKTVKNILNIETGQLVEIWRGWITSADEKIFSGYIESFEPESGLIKIVAKDKMWDLIRKEVTHTYDYTIDASAGKISEIWKDLVNTYGLLTADATSVQDSGNLIIQQKFICNHTDIFERCKRLANILDWQQYYRADTDKVYFEPKGFTTNTLILQVGTNIISIPKWTYDNTEMVNDLTIKGYTQEIETTESGRIGVTSGYTTTGISLVNMPISVKVYGDASNPPTTLKTGGIPDSTITYDYSVDINQKKILPANGTTFTGNDYYEIRYSYGVPVPVHRANAASITKYGQFKKTVQFEDLKTISDAEARGDKYLTKYASPFVLSTLKVKSADTNNFRVGQQIRVIDSVNTPNVDGWFIITRYRIRYPSDYDELVVGDKVFRLAEWQASVEERLKRLKEEESQNEELLTEIVEIDNTLANKIKHRPRYRKIMTITINGPNLFILGHPTYGILGTSMLGDSDLGSETLFTLWQYDNKYIEAFYDEDFKSSSQSNWDLVNRRLRWY
jgi:hypothetical protein